MSLTKRQREEIDKFISSKIEDKLKNYGRETKSMPFLARIIQDNEKIAAYSFIHSISTSLGSFYEDISVIIAKPHCDRYSKKYKLEGFISPAQKEVIGTIIINLKHKNRETNIKKEIQDVLKANRENANLKSVSIADFYMQKKDKEYYFEIKTPKPNIDVFEKSKTKLLEWVAIRRKRIYPYLAFPYNPYYPKPYERFTRVNLVKNAEDFLVGEKYWDFLGGHIKEFINIPIRVQI